MCVQVHRHKGQRRLLAVLLYHSILFETEPLIKPGSQKAPSILLTAKPQHWVTGVSGYAQLFCFFLHGTGMQTQVPMFEQHVLVACKAISPASLSPVSLLTRGFGCANHRRCSPDLSPQGRKGRSITEVENLPERGPGSWSPIS